MPKRVKLSGSPEQRFWPRVERHPSGCWLWTGARTTAGYGHFWVPQAGRNLYAHRFAYELLVGPIPKGLTIDHLCRVRHCVNPTHLEPVSSGVNTRRGEPAQRTHCPQGHPYDQANTYIKTTGRRGCRTCGNARDRRRRRERERQAMTTVTLINADSVYRAVTVTSRGLDAAKEAKKELVTETADPTWRVLKYRTEGA